MFIISPVIIFLSGRQPLTVIKGLKQIYESAISGFSLNQKYPNSFNNNSNIKFDIPKRLFVKLINYNPK